MAPNERLLQMERNTHYIIDSVTGVNLHVLLAVNDWIVWHHFAIKDAHDAYDALKLTFLII